MVYVEAGKTSFENGWVEVENDFYINKYSVTQSEFEDVMGFNPSYYINNPNNPVETVTWYDAVLFCNRLNEREDLEPYYNIGYIEYFNEEAILGGHPNNIKSARVTENPQANGYRLPTREEHEYAARGGYDGLPTTYAGCDDLNKVGWYWSNSGDNWLKIYTDYGAILNNNNQTKPVGQKQPNELGLSDMSGNVWNYTNTFNGDFIYKRGGSYQYYSEVYSIGAVGYDTLTSLSDRYHYEGFSIARSHN